MSNLSGLMEQDDELDYEDELAALNEGLDDGEGLPMDVPEDDALLEDVELEWTGNGECGAEVIDTPAGDTRTGESDELAKRKAAAWQVAQAALHATEAMFATPAGEGEKKNFKEEGKRWAERVIRAPQSVRLTP